MRTEDDVTKELKALAGNHSFEAKVLRQRLVRELNTLLDREPALKAAAMTDDTRPVFKTPLGQNPWTSHGRLRTSPAFG